ncbi:helix-turn-helix transcriptional regulator [Hazenella sp. IB182353]|uniref:helix-turn-helix domain-containing protein n=1 Tax=Polycladospora coralii TaxID=2771432 RepID=UPI0017471129|nr:helix-turn-helix transcriptional regulator [Polycladospora coralii]MBS7531853.1 helix-turn-helix transcriptional regulator [Polycladospora coralii]
MEFRFDRLRELRQERGWSQVELSNQLNVSKQTINDYEQGKKKPSRENLVVLAGFFDTSIDYLMGRTDIRETIDEKIVHLKRKEERVNELEKGIKSSNPDLDYILNNTTPTFKGKPITEEDAEFFIQFFDKFLKRSDKKDSE